MIVFMVEVQYHSATPVMSTYILPEIKVAMSESLEVCQFSSTEAISTHCYNISASNLVQRFLRCLGTFAFTNFKMSALVKNVCTFLSYFILFLCIFEVITDFVLLLTMTFNIQQ